MAWSAWKKKISKYNKYNNNNNKNNNNVEDVEGQKELVYSVYLCCNGCASNLKKSLLRVHGVVQVATYCNENKVVVKGKYADPLMVLVHIERNRPHKSRPKAELLTQLKESPAEDETETKEDEKETPEEEEEKEEKKEEVVETPAKEEEEEVENEEDSVVTLKAYLHCERCAQKWKKRIEKMKGVKSATPDLESYSRIVVRGHFQPEELVRYVYEKLERRVVIVDNEEELKGWEEEEIARGREEEEKKKEEEEKEGENDESYMNYPTYSMGDNEFYAHYPTYTLGYTYPPQTFSDENPTACSVM